MKEECIYKGNIVRGLINGAKFRIEDIKNDNGVTYVHFRDLKTGKLNQVTHEHTKFLLFKEVENE